MKYNSFYAKSLYFTCFASLGILSPYLPVFFEELNMNKTQIGILSMIPNVAAFTFGPVWSAVCDNFHAHNQVMLISIIVSAALFQVMNYLSSFTAVFSINLVGSFFRAPMTPLLDSFVISSLPDKRDYGSVRLWGAVSFGICSLVGGMLTSHTSKEGDDVATIYSPIFIIATVSSILTAMIVAKLVNDSLADKVKTTIDSKEVESIFSPMKTSLSDISESRLNDNPVEVEMVSISDTVYAPAKRVADDENDGGTSSDNPIPVDPLLIASPSSSEVVASEVPAKQTTARELIALIFSPSSGIPIFSLIVLLSGLGGGVIDAFLFLRLKQLGGSSICMGTARIITCAAEIPMFQVAGNLHAKYGTWKVLAVTQLAFVVRFLYYSELTQPWWVLPCEVLHGLTFATTWSVSCTFANQVSPPGANATMQAILEGLHFGLGSGLGALLGGFIYDAYGAVMLFRMCAGLSLIACVLASSKAIEEACRDSAHSDMRTMSTLLPTQDEVADVA